MGNDILSLPVGRYGYIPPVCAGMVVLHGHFGRIAIELVFPRVAHIHISRVAVAVKLPKTWHAHLAPSPVVVVLILYALRESIRVAGPEELPLSIESQVVGRPFRLEIRGFGLGLVSEVVGVHHRAVHFIHSGILPLGETLGRSGKA